VAAQESSASRDNHPFSSQPIFRLFSHELLSLPAELYRNASDQFQFGRCSCTADAILLARASAGRPDDGSQIAIKHPAGGSSNLNPHELIGGFP